MDEETYQQIPWQAWDAVHPHQPDQTVKPLCY